MTWRILVDWLPDNDESRAEPIAHGRICHLEHDPGSEVSDMHAYFEVSLGHDAPMLLDDERDSPHHLVATAIMSKYPRFQGSVWDLIAAALVSAHRGWPMTKET